MKTRNDFVSNSSSSSFIVISKTGNDETALIKSMFSNIDKQWETYPIPYLEYKTEFGWENEVTSSFAGKLNFIGLQLAYLLMMKTSRYEYRWYKGDKDSDFDKYFNMVKKVCKEKFDLDIEMNSDIFNVKVVDTKDGNHNVELDLKSNYYIDHQSCVTENQCMEMFESEEALENFLKYNGSYVQGGNDNQ